MDTNVVIERMAKTLQKLELRAGNTVGRWEKTTEKVKNYYRQDILEFLRIVEKELEPKAIGGDVDSAEKAGDRINCTASVRLIRAFQQAKPTYTKYSTKQKSS